MKKILLFFVIILFTTAVYSQNNFKKGYFINEKGDKIECLIYDKDWKYNPTSIEYKLSENSKIQEASIDRIQEFGIYSGETFVRSTVKMDRSSTKIINLSDNRNPEFKENTLFLKILVNGKASLYSYQEEGLFRYFYDTDTIDITQLIYKKYLYSAIDGIYRKDNQIGENNQFRQQLYTTLKCEEMSRRDYENLNYTRKDLVDFFVKYNQCINADYTKIKRKKVDFNLNIRPGIVFVKPFEIINTISNARNVKINDGSQIFRIGLEAEVILPFNNNKWSIIVEPTYRTFSGAKDYDSQLTVTSDRVEVDYTSLELPVGVRHSFFLGKNTQLFLNASAFFEIQLDSKITYISSNPIQFPISNFISYTIGGGVKYSDFSLELRYLPPRNLLFSSTIYYQADYSNFSLIVGYTLF